MIIRRLAGPVAAGLLLISGSSVAAAQSPPPVATPEPSGYWTGPLRGVTPDRITGGRVIDVERLERLMTHGEPLLIDVGPQEAKPAGLDANKPWMPTHRTIPGAVWLAGAGAGDLSPPRTLDFAARLNALTRGDRHHAMVIFCHSQCWASWNAAKRLIGLGYDNVYWFPGGIEAWQDNHASAPVEPDSLWGR